MDADLFALTPVISVRPVVLPAAERGADLQVRVTAPTTGRDLPIIVFSHGFGEPMDGYAPLAEFWAAHGFAVLQPTHLDSQTLGIAPDDPRPPVIWRFRIEDLTRVLDELDLIEVSRPRPRRSVERRSDRCGRALVGHHDRQRPARRAHRRAGRHVGENMSDPRVVAGVLLAVAGTGGDDLAAFAAEHFSFMNPSFAQMTSPALVVAGDQDQSPLAMRGPNRWSDAYTLSPADKSLLTLFDAEHSMGGIAGHSTHETTDWSLERIALIQQVTTPYLRSALNLEDEAWSRVRAALANDSHPLGRLQSK